MDKLERAQKLHRLLQSHGSRPVDISHLCGVLECGEKTVRRLIYDMRLYLDAPILNIPQQGYFYAKNATFELPGVWFSNAELQALLTIQQFTANLSGGFFDDQIQAIQGKVERLLHKNLPLKDNISRIRVLGTGSRGKKIPMFPLVATALLKRQRLVLKYYSRQNDAWSKREVSPQHLVFYKGNWYLDAWCHNTDAIKSFAVEKISKASLKASACKELSRDELDKLFTKSFGIFSGEPIATAILHFTEKAARWVEDEQWFPDEMGKWLDHGIFELRIPYSNPTELIMEICKHGDDVKVIEPAELCRQVAERLRKAGAQYS